MKSLHKHLTITIFALLVVVLFSSECVDANDRYATYFQYNSLPISTLKKLSSPYKMNVEQLRKWDSIMFNLVKQNKLGGILAAQIYAYVYIAQRDSAFLSQQITQLYRGSFEPISSKVLCLYFPNHCKSLEKLAPQDTYSNKLAEIVLEKIKLRMELDKKQSRMYPQKLKGKNYWAGVIPYIGQDTGSVMPWIIASPKAYLPPAIPLSEWQKQLRQTKEALKHATPDQIKSVHYWAGVAGTITPFGIWLNIANKYMDTHDTPLTKRLYVRSVLATGIFDSTIAVFHAKYIYWARRPFMLDSSLKTVIPTPNHPSYPAGHSALSATAAIILSYYFPKDHLEWWRKANEASQSRVIGAIHFPVDIEQGVILGKKVGKAVLRSSFAKQ